MLIAAKRLLLAFLVLLCLQCGAEAHNIGESSATFYVRATGLDVELYMGMPSGCRLIADEGQIIQMTPNNFTDFSDRLQEVAPDLFTLIGGDGTTLKPDAMNVSRTETTDVFYTLHYPLPAPMPGILRIRAAYLDKMVETHTATIYVMNAVGDPFGLGTLSPDSQDMQVSLPAVGDLIKTNAPATAITVPPGAGARHGGRWVLWGLLGGSALIVGTAWRAIARQREERKASV